MNRAVLVIVLLFCSVATSANQKISVLTVFATHYDLDISLNFVEQKMDATATITAQNEGSGAIDVIPVRLYRMLQVSEVTDSKGEPLEFIQQVVSNEDFALFQSNYIRVIPKQPIKPQQRFQFSVRYSGHLKGYTETGMNYLKDDITSDFSIIRMDAYAYPLLTVPNDDINRAAKFWLKKYGYHAKITVPKSHVVANGGQLIANKQLGEQVQYEFKNILPAWRMDFAIAPYQVTIKPGYRVYSLQNNPNSERYLQEATQVMALFEHWFGKRKINSEFSFIEIPKGYGAQADVSAVIQDSDGFADLKRLYHELSHLWDVKSLDSYSPRWNEGKATFMELLVEQKLTDQSAEYLEKHLDELLKKVQARFAKSQKYQATPFERYGEAGLNAYDTGALFYALLYNRVGQARFNQILEQHYAHFFERGAYTQDFVVQLRNLKDDGVDKLLNSWVGSTIYAKQIQQATSFKQLTQLTFSNDVW